MSGGSVAAEVRELRAIVGALVVEVRQLRADLAASPRTVATGAVKACVGAPVDLAATILAAVGHLDAVRRFGGVVPLPALRAELAKRGATDRAAVDAALVDLERRYAVDLLIAQDPTRADDRAAGIEQAGRGLIFYVSPRPPATQGEG